jgi:phage terminase large subunit
MADRLPPGCGEDLNEPILFNKYQQEFLRIKRLRFCLACRTVFSVSEEGLTVCHKCGAAHRSNATAPRLYNVMGLFAGRQGGKTKIAALGALQEIIIPGSVGWIMGPTYKILHDSTFPTLIRLIPPSWIRKWDPEHMEIIFTNGSKVAFRSLEDPERARGPKVTWGWFDEAAIAPERAFHVFTPTLATTGGAIILSTSPAGFDWTWEQAWKASHILKIPGIWAVKYKTIENPIFDANPALKELIERKRLTMTPEMFRQEYEADFVNFEGAVYGHDVVENACLDTAEQVKKFIPEWPEIDPTRPVVVGLDSGVDHPFGAVLIVSTPKGLVVVSEYLERQQAISQHLAPIAMRFGLHRFSRITYAANKNEANLRLEWGLKGVGVVPAENKHQIGIQRVHSWLGSRQLFFAYSVPKTIEQFKAYRYADNLTPDGQRKPKEEVFKKWDELPDAVRYAIMAWPELPDADRPVMTDSEQARWDAFDDRTRQDIQRVKDYEKQKNAGDLDMEEEMYPLGGFFGSDTTSPESMLE